MSRISIESFDSWSHALHMPEYPVVAPTHVVVVTHGRYRLEFLSMPQLAAAIHYFTDPRGSTRLHAAGGDHWEFQPWHCRLPAGITARRHRLALLAALAQASRVASEELGWKAGEAQARSGRSASC